MQPKTENKLKVMIVDDSNVISRGLENLLKDIIGIEIVTIAQDGLQAISEFSKTNPDLVILDLMIPKINGIDVLKEIRALDDNTVIIVLTNYNQSYFRKLCSEFGADYFLDKSVEFEKVYKICLNIISPNAEHDTDYLLLNNHKRNIYGRSKFH